MLATISMSKTMGVMRTAMRATAGAVGSTAMSDTKEKPNRQNRPACSSTQRWEDYR
jgi:hypothetical protein